ncbi:hypothetical protein GBAR_LOCUS18997, partial [Geodia barretti]
MECGCEGAHLIVQRRVVSPQGIIKKRIRTILVPLPPVPLRTDEFPTLSRHPTGAAQRVRPTPSPRSPAGDTPQAP